ncbi:hypothetical protein [Priestia megaterium]|uniref:hypothetical protein n=1 Tax=Priestia megaterium TaxID=1404 RepID=UPI000BEB6B76|nr:hypothetical protein [Priestia megaterium]PED63988.1 hypothetical protein CON20_23785 [Priestia megaterium]
MKKLTNEQISKAVKLTIDDYVKLRTDKFFIDAYKDSQQSITIESIAENNLDFNMNDIEFTEEDLKEVIRISKEMIA